MANIYQDKQTTFFPFKNMGNRQFQREYFKFLICIALYFRFLIDFNVLKSSKHKIQYFINSNLYGMLIGLNALLGFFEKILFHKFS